MSRHRHWRKRLNVLTWSPGIKKVNVSICVTAQPASMTQWVGITGVLEGVSFAMSLFYDVLLIRFLGDY